MKEFTLRFDMENNAFEDCDAVEAKRILLVVADAVANGGQKGFINDINGNKVGYWEIS
jgi:hypothetical protein